MYFDDNIIKTWIAPLIIGLACGIFSVLFAQSQSKKDIGKQNRKNYLYKMHITVDNAFVNCLLINIYKQENIQENLNLLEGIITKIYSTSENNLPLINIDDDKYIINQILNLTEELNNALFNTKNLIINDSERENKVERIYTLRNECIKYCYSVKSIILNR